MTTKFLLLLSLVAAFIGDGEISARKHKLVFFEHSCDRGRGVVHTHTVEPNGCSVCHPIHLKKASCVQIPSTATVELFTADVCRSEPLALRGGLHDLPSRFNDNVSSFRVCPSFGMRHGQRGRKHKVHHHTKHPHYYYGYKDRSYYHPYYQPRRHNQIQDNGQIVF